MSYLNSFRTLVKACSRFSGALPPVQLNGYLSAIAAGPEPVDEGPWQKRLLGTGTVSEEIRELADACLEAIREDIGNREYEPFLVEGRFGKPRVGDWMQGFNLAVDLDEPTWRESNETHIDTGETYVYLQSLANPGVAEILGIKPAYHKRFVKESIDTIGPALMDLHDGYRDIEDEPLEPLPEHSPEELREYSDDELIELLREEGDLLPRSVVDECIRRQATLLPRLRGLLEEPVYYDEDAYDPEPTWWPQMHAIFILGALEGRDAAAALLYAIEVMHRYHGSDIWENISGYWPALFRNKMHYAAEALTAVAENRELRWQPRINAFECLLDAARARGPEAQDRMLARSAEVAGDRSEDLLLRMLLGMHLVGHPRDAHRPLLEQLAEEQEESATLDIFFDREEVADAYARGDDEPEWFIDSEFLDRYDPDAIRSRQISRRMEELEEDGWEDSEDHLFADSDAYPPQETYVRSTPKVGRNDPCPCGSGKKYKKCCGR